MSRTREGFIIITGLSGAGKSTALHTLEDLGCFCTDNLPLPLLSEWSELARQEGRKSMAVCVDVRSARPDALLAALAPTAGHRSWRLIFLEASDEALLHRFSTLRRRHPFDADLDLPQAIAAEREALLPLAEMADMVLDTSTLNPYELGDLVESFLRPRQLGDGSQINVSIISFSYQRGLPLDADMVVDVRFLANPHYQRELAGLTGMDEAVQAFLVQQPHVEEAETKLREWLRFIWPRLQQERKQYFTLAIGCSGGRHRSVYLAERLAAWMRKEQLADPWVRHRELMREQRTLPAAAATPGPRIPT